MYEGARKGPCRGGSLANSKEGDVSLRRILRRGAEAQNAQEVLDHRADFRSAGDNPLRTLLSHTSELQQVQLREEHLESEPSMGLCVIVSVEVSRARTENR